MLVSELHEGDCFAFLPATVAEREKQRLEQFNELAKSAGMESSQIKEAGAYMHIRQWADVHIVIAVDRDGDRISRRVRDSMLFVWYCRPKNSEGQVTAQADVEYLGYEPEKYEAEIKEREKARKDFDRLLAKTSGQNKKKRKSKKLNKKEELVDRTEVANK